MKGQPHRADRDRRGESFRNGRRLQEIEAELAAPRVVLAEDDRDMRDLVAWSLRKRGHDVIECGSGAELLQKIDAGSRDQVGIDLIISDVRMPAVTGLEALERIRAADPFSPVIVMTAFPEVETRVGAAKLGVAAFFTKPFEIAKLCDLVDRILSQCSVRTERQRCYDGGGPATEEAE